jgi:formiminotetrahydrofolate cyclodeaminase
MTQFVESLENYMRDLASAAPTPGGGSAALVVGSAACGLVAMTARICAQSKKYLSVHSLAQRLATEADALRDHMLELRERDEAAFEAVVEARGNTEAMQRALNDAASTPLEGAQTAFSALQLSLQALNLKNEYLVSDVGCAAEFAYAALMGCAYNVRINHKHMRDQAVVSSQRGVLHALEANASELINTARAAVNASLYAQNDLLRHQV